MILNDILLLDPETNCSFLGEVTATDPLAFLKLNE